MNEMRKTGRVFDRCQLVIKVQKPGGAGPSYGLPRYGHTTDFSAGGMRIVLGEDVPPGATVKLVLVLLEPPAIFEHVGVVRWSKLAADGRKYFIGVELTASTPAMRQAWLRMLAERYPNNEADKRAQPFAKDADSIW